MARVVGRGDFEGPGASLVARSARLEREIAEASATVFAHMSEKVNDMWRPISDAPFEESVLAAQEDEGGEWTLYVAHQFRYKDGSGPGWQISNTRRRGRDHGIVVWPSHWRPLPAHP